MPKLIYCRILGNALSLSTQSINAIVMLTALQDEIILKDPEIRILASMQSRFLTIWNIAFQIAYAFLALTCDVLTILNRDHLLPKPIKKYRDTIFSSIVFPGTLLVFSIFWPIFLYDRSVIFPAYIDKVFSTKSNFVIHFAILPFVLWELAFQPRNKPKTHFTNISLLMVYYFGYHLHVHLTYLERGIWPYPFAYKIYGTMYYYYMHILCLTWILTAYFVQWPLYSWIWGKDKKNSKKIK